MLHFIFIVSQIHFSSIRKGPNSTSKAAIILKQLSSVLPVFHGVLLRLAHASFHFHCLANTFLQHSEGTQLNKQSSHHSETTLQCLTSISLTPELRSTTEENFP